MARLIPPFVAILVLLIFANSLLWHALSSNQQAGIYPPNADSISIPMLEAAVNSVLILIFSGLSIALPKKRLVWRAAKAMVTTLAAVLSLGLSASWLSLHHYSASAGFGLVALACVWSWCQTTSARQTQPFN